MKRVPERDIGCLTGQSYCFCDNTRGCNAKCFKQSKTIAQGRSCVKFFRVRYELDENTDRPAQRRRSPEDRKKVRNRKRLERRKRMDNRLRREDRERREADALETLEGEALRALYESADNGGDDGKI